MPKETPASPGPGVDREGRPVIDPTLNVRELVSADVKRQDDLRELDGRWRDRLERVQIDHAWEIRRAEADRIDAILAAGATNVQRAAEVQSGVAERLVVQVAETATAFEGRLRSSLAPLEEAIGDLRRSQYQEQGQKTQVVETRASADDLAPLLTAIGRLEAAQSQRVGQETQVVQSRATGASRALWISLAIAALGLMSATVLGLVSVAVVLLLR